MSILVLNCGSQSVKWKLFDEKLKLLMANKVDIFTPEDFEKILEKELGQIEGVNVVGHRVVHGGEVFNKPTLITNQNIAELEKISHLAPLHNPFNILGIKVCQKILPEAKNIAVFDTEFFANLPKKASTYALPKGIREEFGFKRYGFHGISHEFVAKKAAEKLLPAGRQGKNLFGKLKMITVHLGGGASVAAIKNGKAIDTSMGFTPLEGLVMATRCGNVDAGIVLEIAKNFSIDHASQVLNRESGIKGICGEGEFLKVLEKIKEGDVKAKLAFDVFVYSVQKYIGSYFAILGGCDLLVFTGAIGAGKPVTRKAICKNLKILSKIKILAIDTDEELAIAKKVLSIK